MIQVIQYEINNTKRALIYKMNKNIESNKA